MRALRNTPGVAAQGLRDFLLGNPEDSETRECRNSAIFLPDEARRVDGDNQSRVRLAINLSGEVCSRFVLAPSSRA
jgi:hypothetical protein